MKEMRKVSACMALYYLTKSASSLGRAPLSSNILFLTMSHKPFCAVKTSNFLKTLHSFLVTLLFSPSIVHSLALLSGTRPSSSMRIGVKIFTVFCGVQPIWLAAVHQFRPPRGTLCTTPRPLHFGPLSSPCRTLPSAFCSHVSNLWLESCSNHAGP